MMRLISWPAAAPRMASPTPAFFSIRPNAPPALVIRMMTPAVSKGGPMSSLILAKENPRWRITRAMAQAAPMMRATLRLPRNSMTE